MWVLVIAILAGLSAPVATAADADCQAASIEELIVIFNHAALLGDVDCIATLLADDFVRSYRPDENNNAPRDETKKTYLDAWRWFVDSPDIKLREFSLSFEGVPRDGDSPGSSVLDGVQYLSSFVGKDQNGEWQVIKSSKSSLTLEIEEAEGGFLVMSTWTEDQDR